MSLSILTNVSDVAPANLNIRTNDCFIDGTLHYSGTIAPSDLTPGSNNTILRTNGSGVVQWDPFIISMIPTGPTGTILRSGVTGVTGSINWGNIALSDIPPGTTGTVLTSLGGVAPSWQAPTFSAGSENQILITSGGVATWSSNIQVPGTMGVSGASTFSQNGLFQSDLAVSGDLNVVDGDVSIGNGKLDILLGNTTLQQLDIGGQLTFNGSAGDTGYYIVQTGTGPQWQVSSISAANITGGSANELLVRNSSNTSTIFTSNPIVPGDLLVQGSLGVTGNCVLHSSLTLNNGPLLTYNNEAGIAGAQVLFSGGTGGICYWDYAGPSTTVYYQNTPVVDLNSGSPELVLFADALPNVVPGTNQTVGYTGGSFTLLRYGIWSVQVRLRPSTMQYRSQVSCVLNGSTYKGSVLTDYDGTSTNTSSLLLDLTFSANTNDVLTIVSEASVPGVVNVNTEDNHGAATSTISLTWLSVGA